MADKKNKNVKLQDIPLLLVMCQAQIDTATLFMLFFLNKETCTAFRIKQMNDVPSVNAILSVIKAH